MLSVVIAEGSTGSGSLIDEIVREGARRMLAAALEAEVNQYIAELAAETDAAGRRLVVRNGHHRPRTVVTAAGPVEVCQRRDTGGRNWELGKISSRLPDVAGEGRLLGIGPGQAPFLVLLEEAQLLRRVRHQQVLRLLVVHGLLPG